MSEHVLTAPSPRSSLVGRVLDGLLDAGVVSLAVWTLLYTLGLPTQWSLHPSGWIWLVVTVVVVGYEVRRAVTTDDPVTVEHAEVAPLVEERRLQVLLAVGVGLVVVSALGGLIWTPGTFRVTWAALAVGLVVLAGWAWASGRVRGVPLTSPVDVPVEPVERAERAEPVERAPRRFVTPSELGVLALMVLTAVAASFIHLADTDDPYYVNRSVWIAERGNAALDDTMFSPEVLNSPYGGGVPISSIEGLFGVIAHMTGTLAGTVTYVVVPPIAAALAVLAMWRLVRRWAPRRELLVLLGAVAFLMLSGDSMLGNFWVPRIWQGKVIAVVVLMPLIWAYLTELHESTERRDRLRALLLLLAAGIAFYGLTPTAVVWAPVMLAAVLLAALALRSPRLALGGVAMAVGPVFAGAVVVVFSTDVGGVSPEALPARASFVRILGESLPMVALGLLALGLAVVLARRGAAAALAGASALGAVWTFAPGVLPLVNTVTGSGPILWRMLYVAPIPVLVGLLLAVRVPALGAGRERVAVGAAAVPALVAVGCLAVGGLPVWSHTGHGGPVTVTSTPRWKTDLPALADVEVLVDRGVTGEVLLPPRRMKVLTIYSVQAFPVVPREWFIQNMKEPTEATRARRLLYRVASGEQRDLPSAATTRAALEVLEVDLACVGETPLTSKVMALYDDAGYSDTVRYGTLHCARP